MVKFDPNELWRITGPGIVYSLIVDRNPFGMWNVFGIKPGSPGEGEGDTKNDLFGLNMIDLEPDEMEQLLYAVSALAGLGAMYVALHPEIVTAGVNATTETAKQLGPIAKLLEKVTPG